MQTPAAGFSESMTQSSPATQALIEPRLHQLSTAAIAWVDLANIRDVTAKVVQNMKPEDVRCQICGRFRVVLPAMAPIVDLTGAHTIQYTVECLCYQDAEGSLTKPSATALK